MLTHLLLLFSSLAFTQYHPQEWGSITSLLTPTGIQTASNGIVYASTSGGLLQFDPITEKFTTIKMEEGLVYLDLSTIEIDSNDRLWLGGAYPNGFLQVYDPDKGLVRKITHLGIAQISKIQIGTDIAFAVYEGATSSDIGILEFILDSDGLPVYKDYYNHFTNGISITDIRDLDLISDIIYVTTNAGIFAGNYKVDNLKSATGWQRMFTGDSAKQFLPELGMLVSNGTILQKDGQNWVEYMDGLNGEIVQVNVDKNGKIIVLTQSWFYKIVNKEINYSFEIPYSNFDPFKAEFTSIHFHSDGHYFMGMKTYGMLALNTTNNSHELYVPNTSFQNEFHALTVTSDGYLAAATQLGLTIVKNGLNYNLLSYPGFKNYPKNHEQSYFINQSLLYKSGEHFPISVIEKENGNLFFGNSGLSPKDYWYHFPGVIELNLSNYNMTTFDSTDVVIDGFWGIYNEAVTNYMVINQIEKDRQGNIWVTNPFCEKNGNMIAIQSKSTETWSHIHIPDENSYRPQTIALDKSNRAWLGFAYEALEEKLYSGGGVKVLKYSNLNFANEDDSTWLTIVNPGVLPGGSGDASIWSMVFDKMDFLWILNEKGIRGYIYSIKDDKITLDPILKAIDGTPIDFLPQVSYTKGNRIKVDSQNNKWVITHQGVWVIEESMAFWPSEEGLHSDNSGLLSDIVYDVAFDNDKGLAYLATDKGISILQIPFADNPSKKQSMYISPNPFIIPNDEGVLIKNVPSGSIIKIMTITGTLIKEIKLSSNESQAIWDGTNTFGEKVGTAVYLVSAHHPSERNKVAKIAVIRK